MAPRKKTSKKPVRKKAVKSPKKSADNHQPKHGFFVRWFKRLIATVVVLLIPLSIYLLYLDMQIVQRFDGKKWAIPARVYAQEMELYVGKTIDHKTLQTELQRLGYQKVSTPKISGTYSRNKDKYHIITRGFQFADSYESSHWFSLRLANNQVAAIKTKSGKNAALLRLEASLIASIYPNQQKDRLLIDYKHLPEGLIAALLVTEDRDFFNHHGVSPKAIFRALLANIKAGKTVQGGSTLTQQLVKNYFLTGERSFLRKFNEAFMSLLLEIRYSKEDILEAYINEIYLGQDGKRAIHGFAMASYFYFGRPINELKLPELALLAGIIKGPSLYNPRKHPKRAKKRRDLVLSLMAEQQLIEPKLADKAKLASLGVRKQKQRQRNRYPAFMQLLRQQLQRDYEAEDLQSEGLKIFTTLRPWMQDKVEKAVASRLKKLDKSRGFKQGTLEAAVIVTTRDSGEIEAITGGRNQLHGQFNRALNAVRPIGSLIKPVVYLTALAQPRKYSLITPIEDKAITLKQKDGSFWRPKNFDKKEYGRIPLHEGLTYSHNLSTVRLGLKLKVSKVTALLHKMGVKRQLANFPSTLLGATDLPPIDVAQFYQTIASGGYFTPLTTVHMVLDDNNQPLTRYPLSVDQVVDENAVYLLNKNLQEVVDKGTAKSLKKRFGKNIRLAGKTGTTDELRDSWFAGFDNNRVTVVWVGRDDNKPARLTGASGALPLWADVMGGRDLQSLDLIKPDNIVYKWVIPKTGRLANKQCDGAVNIPFIKGSEPTIKSPCMPTTAKDLMDLVSDWF